MDRLKGKRALITGASSGIGLVTARRFAEEGARVAVTARDAKSFDAVRREAGEGVVCIVADAADAEGQRTLAAKVKEELGGLDALFVNAGIADLRPVERWDEAGFDRTFALNVRGPFFLIQALLEMFGNPASIVLNASINADIGMPNTSVYGASKAALLSMARTLSGELAGRGIRVNAVSPGPIDTPLYGKLGLTAEQLKATAAALEKQVPAGRFGRPEEIANAVVFLASDESGFTVGSELIIDGGLSL
ncbi:MAG TPA: SDR family oxidoreductase [Acidobacteriaceae bacterium]|nr:SDR family oxidoreductase [Acidobacteriaceae bacterium]